MALCLALSSRATMVFHRLQIAVDGRSGLLLAISSDSLRIQRDNGTQFGSYRPTLGEDLALTLIDHPILLFPEVHSLFCMIK